MTNIENLPNLVESILFGAGRPMRLSEIKTLMGSQNIEVDLPGIKVALNLLEERYADSSIEIKEVASGFRMQVKEIYGATIPVDKREGAFNWLRNNDLGDLIKNEITVSFGRNEDNKASDYANLAESNGYQPVQKLKVEPMTLKALFRERVEKDLDLPSEHFNLFKGNKTKITRNK